MIQVSEFRIGNLVNSKQGYCHITHLYHNGDISSFNYCKFPDGQEVVTWENEIIGTIPLTPEILIKCGFSVNDKAGNWHSIGHTIYSVKGFSVGVRKKYIGWYNKCEDDFYSTFYPEIKYLHQLQNLYYALTGVELEVKSGLLHLNHSQG
jgi:hypothetical protein